MSQSALKPVSFKKGRAHEPRLSKPYVRGKKHERYWSEAEDAVLREHFPTGGMNACLPSLQHRGPGSIYLRANKLGIKVTKQHAPRRYEWPADLDERIIAAWPSLSGKGATNAWADANGLHRRKVTQRATALGLTKPWKKELPWTAAEEALLARIPRHNPEVCARIFREHGFARSPTAIMIRCKRIGLARRYNETFSATSAAKIFGVDNKTFCSWCIAGDVKATKRTDSKRLPQQGGAPWSITRADLRSFAIEKLDRIDIRKVDKFAFVDLLVNLKESAR